MISLTGWQGRTQAGQGDRCSPRTDALRRMSSSTHTRDTTDPKRDPPRCAHCTRAKDTKMLLPPPLPPHGSTPKEPQICNIPCPVVPQRIWQLLAASRAADSSRVLLRGLFACSAAACASSLLRCARHTLARRRRYNNRQRLLRGDPGHLLRESLFAAASYACCCSSACVCGTQGESPPIEELSLRRVLIFNPRLIRGFLPLAFEKTS